MPWLRLGLLLCGLLLVLVAGRAGIETVRFVARADQAAGIVSRLNAGGSHPQIEFHTPGGPLISYAQGGLIGGLRPGDRVKVLYNRSDPAHTARISGFMVSWGEILLWCGFGVFLIGLSVASWIGIISPDMIFLRGR